MYRDGEGRQQLVVLDDVGSPTTVGRRSACDVALAWDSEVSRLHARFEHVGHEWTLVDDGLSRNGSFVNGERVVGRRRLRQGDPLRFRDTLLVFPAPTARRRPPQMTAIGRGPPGPRAVSAGP